MWLRSGSLQVSVLCVQGRLQWNRAEANRRHVAKGDAHGSVCGCSTICLCFWWARQHLRKGFTSPKELKAPAPCLVDLIMCSVRGPRSCSHQPHISPSLSSYNESISFCVQEQQDVSWKEAGRAGLAWTRDAKMKKPPDISTQLSDKLTVEWRANVPPLTTRLSKIWTNMKVFEGRMPQNQAQRIH